LIAPPGYPPLCAFLGAPLKYAGKAIGVIALGKIAGVFDPADQESLENLSFAMVEAFMRQRAEQALRRAHDELEQRVKERTTEILELRSSFTSWLLDAQEKERKRISHELHEELGQSLAVLKMQLRRVEKNLPAGMPKEQLWSALDHLNEVVDDVRRLSQDLRPSILEHMGIAAALKHLADAFSKENQIPVALDMDSIQGLFSPEAEVIIYRIFQEAFANIAQHARASSVMMSIKKSDGGVAFQVEDDGQGFDSPKVLNEEVTRRGLGLAAMTERMRMLHGSLDIWSREGQGTRISFVLPIKSAPISGPK
jgi:signal transduction histidine kinase